MPAVLTRSKFPDVEDPTRGVDLVAIVDTGLGGKPNRARVFIHPDSPFAQGQVMLDLRNSRDTRSMSGLPWNDDAVVSNMLNVRMDCAIPFSEEDMTAMFDVDQGRGGVFRNGRTLLSFKADLSVRRDPFSEKYRKSLAEVAGVEFDPKSVERFWRPVSGSFKPSDLPIGREIVKQMEELVRSNRDAMRKDVAAVRSSTDAIEHDPPSVSQTPEFG